MFVTTYFLNAEFLSDQKTTSSGFYYSKKLLTSDQFRITGKINHSTFSLQKIKNIG